MANKRLYTKSELKSIGGIDKINLYYDIQEVGNRYSLKLKPEFWDDQSSMNARHLEVQLAKLDPNSSQ